VLGEQAPGRVVAKPPNDPGEKAIVSPTDRYSALSVARAPPGRLAYAETRESRQEFEAAGDKTRLTDHIEYEMPGGSLVNMPFGWITRHAPRHGETPSAWRRHARRRAPAGAPRAFLATMSGPNSRGGRGEAVRRVRAAEHGGFFTDCLAVARHE